MARFASAFSVLCLGAACLLGSAPARADSTEEARKLYNDARKAMQAKDYKAAASGFEAASLAAGGNGVALYTAAQAWELAGDLARAADAYALALATPKLSESQTERSKERLAALEKELGVVQTTGLSSTKVQLDDHMTLPAGGRLYGAPGEHTLKISREDGTSEERPITLAKGEVLEVDTAPQSDTKEPSPQAKEVPLEEPKKQPVLVEKKDDTLKIVGFATIGAGVAALGGGVLMGMTAKDAEDTYKSEPTRATLDHAKGLETRTNIMLIAGGVLTAAGVGIVVWQATKGGEKPPTSTNVEVGLRVGPRAVWAEGRF